MPVYPGALERLFFKPEAQPLHHSPQMLCAHPQAGLAL
jgi:hypothetical protein